MTQNVKYIIQIITQTTRKSDPGTMTATTKCPQKGAEMTQ